MWSLFSRDPLKDFAYDVGEIVPGLEDRSIWSLHEGKKKVSGDPVSIFVFDVKNASESQIQLARGAFKRIKTLRHPNVLTFLDGIENEKVIYVVTEPVVPLETHIRNNKDSSIQNELAISWGLHQVVKGLSFLVNDCNLIHNNVCISSMFVDRAGEWKLGGVDYMYPAQGPDSNPPVKILPALEIYDPPEKGDPSGRNRKVGEKWSSDMWGLGCLIWEVFNGNLPKTTSLKALGKIPKPLVPNYCELVGANPRTRPNPSKFLQDCFNKGGFMNNKFVETMLFLEEIQIKDQNEKTKFFNSLSSSLDSFPQQFCKHKVLPQLINAYEFGNAGSAVLAPLFKLGKLLETEEYQKKIVPCVVKLFSSTDRATRVKLLQQMEYFVEHLQPNVVNDQICPHVMQGFMDTNPVVREHTIKAMLHLAPKLNYKNLNEELLKHFARLQSKDDQGGIRTNTTVCLGKIACHLDPQMRQRVLSSAFLRALKDPFPPARQAGILAMAATQSYYPLKEVACKLMPALSSMTMDPEKLVRDQAFKAIKCFLAKLEKVSENPELAEEMERELSSSSAAQGAAGWAGWAMTGMSSIGSLTSKLYKSKSPSPGAGTPGQNASANGKKPGRPSLPPDMAEKPAPAPAAAPPTAPPSGRAEQQEGEGGGWGQDGWDDEDWGDMDDVSGSKASGGGAEETVPDTSTGDGWEDEDWGSLEETTTPAKNTSLPGSSRSSSSASGAMRLGGSSKEASPSPWEDDSGGFVSTEDSGLKTASSYNWGQTEKSDDFFSSMVEPKSKPKVQKSMSKPASTTQTSQRLSAKPTSSAASPSGGGGWDDDGWGNEGDWGDNSGGGEGGGGGEGDWGTFEDKAESKQDAARRKREERNLQRQKELQERKAAKQGGGAMRLGAKKLARD